MGQGVRTVLGHSFCNSSRTPNNVANPFSTLEICFFFKKILHVLFLRFNALWGNRSSEEITFCGTEMTFVHCQFKACFLNAFEGCSQVGDEMISIVGCDAVIVHVLGTLVYLNDFIKVFSDETGECGQCPTKALLQTTVCKYAACKVEG